MIAVMAKACKKCGCVKPLSFFYQRAAMADGHRSVCKDCTKEASRRNRQTDHARETARIRNRLPKNRAMSTKSTERYVAQYPERQKAKNKLNNTIRDGKMQRGKICEVCGSNKNIHGHHDDYNKPLEVRWLCASHHRQFHSKNRDKFAFEQNNEI